MTVKDLIAALQEMPQDAEVIVDVYIPIPHSADIVGVEQYPAGLVRLMTPDPINAPRAPQS